MEQEVRALGLPIRIDRSHWSPAEALGYLVRATPQERVQKDMEAVIEALRAAGIDIEPSEVSLTPGAKRERSNPHEQTDPDHSLRRPHVVLPEAEYEALIEAVEDQEDIAAGKEMLRRIAAGEEELIPAEVVNRLLDSSESKIRIWREYRGLSAYDLAAKVEISTAYLSQIETGAREGSIDTFKRIAAVLGVSIDDLV